MPPASPSDYALTTPFVEGLRYIRNQWPRLIGFLDDPKIPIHNNAPEAALRTVALARKNSLFFGNDPAGRRFMILYSLIATCERHDVNPEFYLADVLEGDVRIRLHGRARRDVSRRRLTGTARRRSRGNMARAWFPGRIRSCGYGNARAARWLRRLAQ